MSGVRSLGRAARGPAAVLGSRLFGKALSFGFIIVLVRNVGEHDVAAYSYLVALALTFSLLSDTGVAVIAGRDVARGDVALGTAYRAGLPAVLAGCAVGALAVAAFGAVDSGPGSTGMALAMTAAFVAVNGLFNFQCDLLRGDGRLGLEAGLQTIAGPLFVLVGTAVVLGGGGLALLMTAFALKEVLMLLLTQRFLPWPGRAPRTRGLAWTLLRAGILVSIASTCLAVVLRASLVVLSNVADVSEAAHYSVAYRFAEIAFMVAQVLGIALLPAMSVRFAADRGEGRRFALRLLGITTAVVAVVTPLLVWVTPAILVFAFGEGYRAAGPAARVLVSMLPVLMALSLAWNALIADRRERPLIVAGVAGVVAAAAGAAWIAHDPVGISAAESALASFVAMGVVCVGAVLLGEGSEQAAPARVVIEAREAM